MDKRKQQQIEDLLRNLQSSKAPLDFTSNVMNDLTSIIDEEMVKDTKLTTLLKKANLDQPSTEFVDTVMTKVQAASSFEYQPLISKRLWMFAGIAIIATISFVYYTAVPSDAPSMFAKLSPYLDQTQSTFESAQSAYQNFVHSLKFIQYIQELSSLI